jgi:Transposase zinc-binding domain
LDRPKLEVADIFRRYGEAYRQQHAASLFPAQRRVMTAIEVCRTAALGGHLERCDCCNHERPCYDSCGDRHCPKCQSLARAEWVEKRTSEVLDTHYFHVVFTIPEQVASIAYQNKNLIYGILFRATAETLSTMLPIPNIWAPRSVFSPYFTVGDRTCFSILICIVSFQAAGFHWMVPGGSPAAPTFSYQ